MKAPEKRLVTRRNRSFLGSFDQERIKWLSRNSTKNNTKYNGKGRVIITFTDTLNSMTTLESVYIIKSRDWTKYADKGTVKAVYKEYENTLKDGSNKK